MNTFNGPVAQPVFPAFNPMMPAPAMNPGFLPKKKKAMPVPPMGGIFGGGNVGIIGNGRVPQITKIEKIFNCVIYEKFINEFKRMLKKYPQKTV